jgi:hypothetical protein
MSPTRIPSQISRLAMFLTVGVCNTRSSPSWQRLYHRSWRFPRHPISIRKQLVHARRIAGLFINLEGRIHSMMPFTDVIIPGRIAPAANPPLFRREPITTFQHVLFDLLNDCWFSQGFLTNAGPDSRSFPAAFLGNVDCPLLSTEHAHAIRLLRGSFRAQ